MDVTLVLTHRCNLACGYCYAGEHVRKDMDDATLVRAVDLLFSDDPEVAQLSFFGGEPFLAFDKMRRAVELAERRAAQTSTRLILQCTTNGSVLADEHVAFALEHRMRITVSIDGVREAHDLHRPCSGGKSSFEQVHRGLRKLVDGGCSPDAMMVISPETVPFVYRSVGFLWAEGVATVRANMVLDAAWTAADRAELREQLLSVSWELVARRRQGEGVRFEPFERGVRGATGDGGGSVRRCPSKVRQGDKVVVGTSGFLYPCAPMVGEDRDTGPEAAMRLGHLQDAAADIKAQVGDKGTRCGRGGSCDCAAYLETGDRTKAGPNGRWFAGACQDIGRAVASAIADIQPSKEPRRGRRPFLLGMAAAVSGLAIGLPVLLDAGVAGEIERPLPCELPKPNDSVLPAPGEVAAPPVEPPDDIAIDGELEVVEPVIEGKLASPPVEPESAVEDVGVRGQLAAPAEDVEVMGDIAMPDGGADTAGE